ncbi:hypothetical protein D917_06247 [Trichinella nativa]|uniref:Uncharacterized protein n=1 Tax=Trichinella nativa TaxID=6335 RepID=A0A1Y3ET19_9BILA|nr:hypothetical protein D917_06247 [Trichinella nativa]
MQSLTACVLFFSLSYGIYETRVKKVLSFAQITCFTAASAILACECVRVIVLLLLLLLASYVHFNSELVVVSSMTTSPLLKSIEFSVQSDLLDTSEHQLRKKMALRLLLQYTLLVSFARFIFIYICFHCNRISHSFIATICISTYGGCVFILVFFISNASDLFSVEMCAYFFLVLFNVYFAFEALTIPNSSLESFALHGQ